ncbi:MAG: tetratricopeptide repeat protein [Bryobacteraceae bacterium]
MTAMWRKLALSVAASLVFAGIGLAQTGSFEGKVTGEDGQPLKDALIKIERTDIRGNYQVKTNKKGQYFHAGLPLGTYKLSCLVNDQVKDSVNNVRTKLGDPVEVSFNLAEMAAKQKSIQKAAETGQLTQEQTREMSAEQKAAIEKQLKERSAAMAKNKALNDAFNQGMAGIQAKQWDSAVEGFNKAAEMDPKQYAVWANMADAYVGLANTKTGADQMAAYEKAQEAFRKAMELKPDDAGTHNNYALLLAKSKKFDEAQTELTKAAQLDPPNAGKYFFNLGAVLLNTGQAEPAGMAFKKAIEADPNYADAQYQYGMYLVNKATMKDNKMVAPEGTKEALQKYLELKPAGPYAESAKALLTAMDATIDTEYKNPTAAAEAAKKKAAKKK